MKELKFNLNEHVKVKLTKSGAKHYKEYFASMGIRGFPITDEDGYLRIQLYSLMYIFGELMYITNELPFELDMIFEIVEKEPVPSCKTCNNSQNGQRRDC